MDTEDNDLCVLSLKDYSYICRVFKLFLDEVY
jgi:hypothetical protein